MAEEAHSHIASPITETLDGAEKERSDTTIFIEKMLDRAEAPTRKKCCIYQVPSEIRKLNDVYTPKVVSIGPLHVNNHILQAMRSQKLQYLKRFLRRAKADLDSLVRLVEESAWDICSYYPTEEHRLYNARGTIPMILVDAGFILGLFCQFFYMDLTMDGAFSEQNLLRNDILMDLFLLENQLPFSLLDEIYNLAIATDERGKYPTLLDLTFQAFKHHNKQNLTPKSVTIYHFTDLLRKFYLKPSQRLPIGQNEMIKSLSYVSSVTELYEAGVKFKADKTSCCLLDLQFSGRTLTVPQLTVDEDTEMLFGNMIALEQSYYHHEQYIMGYVFLLRCLMKTDEDADVLVKNGIIVNYLSHSNDVVRLFYRLGKNTTVITESSEYNLLCQKLNDFCRDRKRRMVTTLRRDCYMDLKRNYFKTPLQTLATVGGILLLILTVIQTVCSILQVL